MKNFRNHRISSSKWILLFPVILLSLSNLSWILESLSSSVLVNDHNNSFELMIERRGDMEYNGSNGHISKPLEMLREYQQWHSQDVLLHEYRSNIHKIQNRTFVLGLYSCPDSAGNRLHEMFNSIIMAIANNFTITWKFYDEKTCLAVRGDRPGAIKWCIDPVNSLSFCDELTKRAPWMASFDEWAPKLNLTFGERSKTESWYSETSTSMTVNYHAPLDKHNMYQKQQQFSIPYGNKVWVPKERVLPISYKDIESWQHMESIAANRYKDLYSLGAYYLYGLIFHEIFPFQDAIKPKPNLVKVVDPQQEPIFIVLHSRHYKDHIDGSDISHEKSCIQEMLQQHKSRGVDFDKKAVVDCRIFIMSDRKTTLDLLVPYITHETKCRPVVTSHETENYVKKFYEHGPFALRGFFQDLALASHANAGFIGNLADTKSSSSALIQELFEYNYIVLNEGKDKIQPPLLCGIPKHT